MPLEPVELRFSAGEGTTGQVGRAILHFAMSADVSTLIGTGIGPATLDNGLIARLHSGFTDVKRGRARHEERRPAGSGRGRFVFGLTGLERHLKLSRTWPFRKVR